MRKVMVVAVREYQAAVKTKAFIISVVALPIFWGGSVAVQMLLHDRVDTTDKKIAVVDYSGQILPTVLQKAEERNTTDIFTGENETRRQIKPRYLIEPVEPGDREVERAALELSDRVRKDEIMAFVIIGRDVVHPTESSGEHGQVLYHSNSPTYDEVLEWMEGPIDARVKEMRLAESNLDAKTVEAALQQTNIQNLGLVSLDAQGNIVKAAETNEAASIFVPMGLMMLMLMVIMVGASPLLQSVLEEKTQRIAEVLLGSVPPFQLMLGKLIGMVGVSLTLATVYLIAAYFGIRRAGFGAMFPSHIIWWFVLYQVLAVMMFGAIFAAIGAAVTELKEAQSLMTPVMLVAMAPLFVWLNVVKEPTSNFAVLVSLFPPATPMLMILRQAVPPGVPLWQPLLGIGLVLLTTLFFVFAGGRIFRVGILMQGKAPKPTELMRWIVRG